MTTSGHSRILMIDDDEGLRELGRRRLQRNDFEVSAAGTLNEARTLMEGTAFDLLVIDYRLAEEMTGLDFYRELRARGLAIPAILCSGFSDQAREDEARACGVSYILPKSPDYLDELPAAVRRVLDPSFKEGSR